MPNFTVSTDVDSFMQGADFAAMRTSLGVKSEADTEVADNRRAFSGGVATNLKGTADDMLSQPMPSIGTGDFTLYWEGKKLTQGGNFAKSLFRGDNGTEDFSIKIDISSGGSYSSDAVTFDFVSGSKSTIYCGAGYFELDATFKFTFDRDGVASVYKNGKLGGTVDISGNSNIDLDFTVAEWFNTQHVDWIGRGLAILNTALTSAQAAEIYRDGLQPWIAANPEYRQGREYLSSEINTLDLSDSTWSEVGGGSATFSAQSVSGGSGPRQVLSTYIFKAGTVFNIRLTATPAAGNNAQLGVHLSAVSNNAITAISSNSTNGRTINSTVTVLVDSYLRVRVESGSVVDWSFSDFELVKVGALANLPLDDDSRQLKDISGNRNDATASEAGVNHLIQKDTHSFRDDHADGTGGSYLIANADILAENEVITGVTIDGRFYGIAYAQDLTKRRIKLVKSGSQIIVKRSDGTTDGAANVTTQPASTTDFAVNVLTQRI